MLFWEVPDEADKATLFVALAALCGISYFVYVIYFIALHPLSDIPGPFSAKFRLIMLRGYRKLTLSNVGHVAE